MNRPAICPRKVLAQEFADYLGDGTIEERITEGGETKRVYRVIVREWVIVDVHTDHVVVNGTKHRSLYSAKMAAYEAICTRMGVSAATS